MFERRKMAFLKKNGTFFSITTQTLETVYVPRHTTQCMSKENTMATE